MKPAGSRLSLLSPYAGPFLFPVHSWSWTKPPPLTQVGAISPCPTPTPLEAQTHPSLGGPGSVEKNTLKNDTQVHSGTVFPGHSGSGAPVSIPLQLPGDPRALLTSRWHVLPLFWSFFFLDSFSLLLILLVPQLIPSPHSLFLIKTSRSQCGPERCHFLFIDDRILRKVTGHLLYLRRNSEDTT